MLYSDVYFGTNEILQFLYHDISEKLISCFFTKSITITSNPLASSQVQIPLK